MPTENVASTTTAHARWTLAVAGAALFMTALDQLVVGVALHSIRLDLGGSIEGLEWTVNAYTLAFALLLITGAAPPRSGSGAESRASGSP
jgi:MFS family permease